MITLNKKSEDCYDVLISFTHMDQHELGQFIRGDDGFFEFWFDEKRHGSWPSCILRGLAVELEKLNAEWEKQLDNIVL